MFGPLGWTLGARQICTPAPALPGISRVTFDKLLDLSGPQFPNLLRGLSF